jgi:hypothetical protein
MRHLLLTALALAALFTAAQADCGRDHSAQDGAHAAPDARAQQSFDDWVASGGDEPLFVTGLLSGAQVQAMRDAHASAGLKLGLTVVPAGGVNAGRFYVSGELAPEMYAAMQAAHAEGALALQISELPVAVAGYRDDDDDDDDEEDDDAMYEDADEPGDHDDIDDDDIAEWHAKMKAAHGEFSPREMRRMHRQMMRAHGGPGMRHGKGHRGAWRGWRGERGNYDLRDRCGHWENDWHQDGCGSVHVHNLADWLPHHAGWGYGFPYGGWDDDYWPHVRGDGSHVWYTGEFWRTADIVYDVPAWFDAQWTRFGEAWPDTFWLSASYGGRWAGHGCGCGSCKRVSRCDRCAKWNCGCGHHKCGCR